MREAQTRSILIVDDDHTILLGLAKRLSAHDFRVVTASSGEDALQAARREHFDAALLDVSLPGTMDGLQLAFRLHEEPKSSHLPIIFVTGTPGDDFKSDCRFVRGKYFVTKPYDADVLLSLLRNIFAADELGEVQRISALKRRQPVA